MIEKSVDFINYCRLMFSYKNDDANKELERIADDCSRLEREYPHQWFSFFADKKYLRNIASEVFDVYELEIRIGDRYTRADLPIGMVVPVGEDCDYVVVQYHSHEVVRAIREPMP